MLEREQVKRLEDELNAAMEKAMRRMKDLPVAASEETLHMMAKAATAVYEAVAAISEE